MVKRLYELLFLLIIFFCCSTAIPKVSFGGSFDFYFDKAVGKFVDDTNKHLVGQQVDNNTRRVQVAAVKFLIDPRSSSSDKYLDEMVDALEGSYVSYKKGQKRSKNKNPNATYCEKKFQQLADKIKQMKARGEHIFSEVDMYYIRILECYLDRKEYNHAVNWVNICENLNYPQNMPNSYDDLWVRQVSKLRMVIKRNDDW